MSSSGLGINFPQPNPSGSSSSPSRAIRGINYNNGRPSPSRSNIALPQAQITPPPRGHSRGAPLYQPGQPLYHGPPQAGQPLYQPQFSLRPTHARQPPPPKGFASFSAIPPSPSHLSVSLNKQTPKTDSTHSHLRTDSGDTTEIPEPARSEEHLVRKSSASTSGTGAGTRSTRGPKRSVSGDIRRKFSKNEEHTISGGAYQQLPDEPSGEAGGSERPRTPTRDTMHSRSDTISTTNATPARSVQHSVQPTPSVEGNGFNPMYFPQPASLLPYRRPSGPPTSHGMPRSVSTPLHLSNIPEVSSIYGRAPSGSGDPKRTSDPVTGVHSRNSALFAAEAGGVMLAYDRRSGVWQEAGDISNLGKSPEIGKAPEEAQTSPEREAQLRARPWSESTMEHSARSFHHRSLSDGVMLARQGTLLHPGSSATRKSQELGLLLGNRRRTPSTGRLLPAMDLQGWQQSGGGGSDQIRVEAAKKRKARVEVDVILERECVVEGGEIRGRMDVRVNGGKRGEGVRVGGGKVRVIGFEDINPESRHIFYHVPHHLPVFAYPPIENGPTSSLFASYPDNEGYRLVNEGVHSLPFNLRLPLNGGAKGSYLPTKGPSVRYVVVGSIKLLMTATGKRSIAHFYRSIVILPYLNPGVVLAPSDDILESRIEGGLGWTLGGDKGKVELRVAMGRANWVAGQRVWFEVGIRNDSNRKAPLLQSVQTFNADTPPSNTYYPNTGEIANTRRKVSEEVVEADVAESGSGKITGREWWTGVEAGERGHWDMSLFIPAGLITIRRSRLIEVSYTLRVTANSSVYVDIPVNLINFLSVDPPPMPGDGLKLRSRLPKTLSNPGPAGNFDNDPSLTVIINREGYPTSEKSSGSSSLQNHAARASSTTLHIDALLAAGRERAQAEAMANLPPAPTAFAPVRQRPLSMGSEYTPEPTPHASRRGRPKASRVMSYLSVRSGSEVEEEDDEAIDLDDEADKIRLQAARREGRKMSLAAIERAMDRQREEYQTAPDHQSEVHTLHTLGKETPPQGAYAPLETPMEESYRLVGDTPGVSNSMKSPFAPSVMGIPTLQPTVEENASPPRADILHLEKPIRGYTPIPPVAEEQEEAPVQRRTLVVANPDDERNPRQSEGRASSFDIDPYSSMDHGETDHHVGDETILEDLMPQDEDRHASHHNQQGEGEGYEYGEDVEATPNPDFTRPGYTSLGELNEPVLPFAASRDGHSNSRNGSFAASFTSEQESLEVGEVQSAIKRNLSVRLPPAVIKMEEANMPRSASAPFLAPSAAGRKQSHTSSSESDSPRGSPRRRGSGPGNSVYSNWGHPRGSTSSVPSPLRTVEEVPSPRIPDESAVGAGADPKSSTEKLWPGRPGFSFGASSSAPSKREQSLSPRKTEFGLGQSPKSQAALSPGPSPRTAHYPTVGAPRRGSESAAKDFNPKPSGTLGLPTSMTRLPSGNSQLRHQVQPDSSSEGDQSPGLAPSAASDNDSSEENTLESPTPAALASNTMVDASSLPTSGVRGTSTSQEDKALPSLPVYSPKSDEGDPMRGMANLLKTMEGNPTIFDDHGDPSASVHPVDDPKNIHWTPGSHLRHVTVNRAELLADPPSPEASAHSHSVYGRSSSPSVESSGHGMLPSVAAKLAQFETRNEALRKFSVASAASGAVAYSGEGGSIGYGGRKWSSATRPSVVSLTGPEGPRPSVASLSYAAPGSTAPLKPVRKRTSYTTALAPRPVRSHSDDVVDGSYQSSDSRSSADEGPKSAPPLENSVGGTTFLSKKSFANSPPWESSEGGVYDPFRITTVPSPPSKHSPEQVTVSRQTSLGDGSGRWKMTKSTSSGSLSALPGAAAQMPAPSASGSVSGSDRATPTGGRPMGPRSPASRTALGYGPSAGGYMSPTSPTPTSSARRYGPGLMPPVLETPTKRGGYTNSTPMPGGAAGVRRSFGAETDDSEGML